MLQYTGIEGLDTYELRHTAASLAIAAGADVKTVQLMLGHASAAMTLDTYAHLWEEGLDAIPDAIESKMAAERESRTISERMKEPRRAGGGPRCFGSGSPARPHINPAKKSATWRGLCVCG